MIFFALKISRGMVCCMPAALSTKITGWHIHLEKDYFIDSIDEGSDTETTGGGRKSLKL